MDVRRIARALGGDIAGSRHILAPGPGHSPHDRSLSVTLDSAAADGFLVHSFAGDDWRDCRGHVKRLVGACCIGDAVVRPAAKAAAGSAVRSCGYIAPDKVTLAHNLWTAAQPFTGSMAERYLRARVTDLAGADLDRSVVRFHPACPFRLADGTIAHLPAMLAAMVDIRTNAFTGIHRTALDPDSFGKSRHPGLGGAKKMLGSAKGACVKLTADENVTDGLHIAEGIETALACLAMGFRPIWACLSAGGISAFPVLSGIGALTVFADHDASGAGLAAARQCASRWTDAGRSVRIFWPPDMGADFADWKALQP